MIEAEVCHLLGYQYLASHFDITFLILDWLCNSYTILRQSLCWWLHYLKLLRCMIVLERQNQIGKEQILVCIEYHISLGNSGRYGKCFHICDILTEYRSHHMEFFVDVFVEFISCYFVLISL